MEFVSILILVNAFMDMEDMLAIKVIYFIIYIFSLVLNSPFCVNGRAISVDKCLCEEGWTGEICEISILIIKTGKCENCLNGICRDDGSCSCNVIFNPQIEHYINSNFTFCEDISYCKIFNPYCNSCNKTNCIDCDPYFTLKNNSCGNF